MNNTPVGLYVKAGKIILHVRDNEIKTSIVPATGLFFSFNYFNATLVYIGDNALSAQDRNLNEYMMKIQIKAAFADRNENVWAYYLFYPQDSQSYF